ncbi:MAG: reverse transcriptase/maturase family protein [Eubacteriales bacterium]
MKGIGSAGLGLKGLYVKMRLSEFSLKQIVLLAVPVILAASTYVVFIGLEKLLGPKAGHLGGMVFYWIVWCLLLPLWALGCKNIVDLFKGVHPSPLDIVLLVIPPLLAFLFGPFSIRLHQTTPLIVVLSLALAIEVVRMILEGIYKPVFSKYSHGFRPNRSCHTALAQIKNNFTGVKWFIEGDIKGCFDAIDHHILISILRKRIKDEYFIALIWKFLKAGYLENRVFHQTYSGAAQGSVISPILANIYLNEFDNFIAQYAANFNAGTKRAYNKEYYALNNAAIIR